MWKYTLEGATVVDAEPLERPRREPVQARDALLVAGILLAFLLTSSFLVWR